MLHQHDNFFSDLVCTTEIIAFTNRIEEFKKADCEILGVSTDSKQSHLMWASVPRSEGGISGINFPLLSDHTHAISIAYGVLKEDEGCAYRWVSKIFIICNN